MKKKGNLVWRRKAIDRLSDLPDVLLLQILSFLPIKEALATHGLSRRWRYLWAFLPSLRLDGLGANLDFVENLMSLYRGSKVYDFRVEVDYNEGYLHKVDSLVQFGIDHGVVDMRMNFGFGRDPLLVNYGFGGDHEFVFYKVPKYLFLSDYLENLELSCCEIKLPEMVYFKCLKSLKLFQINLTPEMVEKWTCACPVLEKLHVEECNTVSTLHIRVTNPSVRSVVIKDQLSGVFEFYGPYVLSLELSGCLRSKYFLRNISSLTDAKINMNILNEGAVSVLAELLSHFNFNHVRLELCNWCMQVISQSNIRGELIPPSNVTCLLLKMALLKCELPGLTRLVEIFPRLDSLTISLGLWCFCEMVKMRKWCYSFQCLSDYRMDYFKGTTWDEITGPNASVEENAEQECWTLMDYAFSCHLQSLKTIELNGFLAVGFFWKRRCWCAEVEEFVDLHKREIELVRLLLKNSPALERMTIRTTTHACLDKGKKAEILFAVSKKLLAFPRASRNAKIIFH